ncbi:hypothetical protein BT96DRAFT_834185, partial [Gymnopus androsaceus JB14]
ATDRGTTTAIVWLTRPDDTEDGLAYGTEDGYLCIWKRAGSDISESLKLLFTEIFCDRLTGGKDGQEVSGMAYDASTGQLAILMHPTVLKSVAISNHWPQGVAFGQTGVKGPKLWIFGREDSLIYVLSVEGKVLKTKTTGTIVGHAAMNTKEDTIILDDVSQGIALYKLLVTDRIKTFPVPHTERRSRNVAFHNGGSTIISGSNHGKVYVFN